jgi:hypothetical protein
VQLPKVYYRSQSWPLGGDNFGIGRHFHCQILIGSPLYSADSGTWVAVRSQEVLQGFANYLLFSETLPKVHLQ